MIGTGKDVAEVVPRQPFGAEEKKASAFFAS